MAQPTQRRRAQKRRWLPITLIVLVAAGLSLGTLYVLNDYRMPWTAAAETAPDRTGQKPYPRAVRTLPAFTAITVEQLVDSKSKQPLVIWLKPEEAESKGLLETSAILGRVLKAEKRAGYGFTEADFLPKGSPPSRTAAIPVGMRGMSILAKQVPTLRGLKANDRFDLVAAADGYNAPLAPKGASVADQAQRDAATRKAFGALTRTIVEGGIVIERMDEGKMASGKDEVFVAIPDDQHDDLLAALNNGIEITCMARSSSPLVQAVPLPEPEPVALPEKLTIQNGSETQTIVLPSSKNGSPQR